MKNHNQQPSHPPRSTPRHAGTGDINRVFSVMRAHDLLLAQPSVCEAGGSGTWRALLHQRAQYELRFVTFVEVMAPAFRMDFFDAVIRRDFNAFWRVQLRPWSASRCRKHPH